MIVQQQLFDGKLMDVKDTPSVLRRLANRIEAGDYKVLSLNVDGSVQADSIQHSIRVKFNANL